MRVSTVAFCTLAVLAARELPNQASATPDPISDANGESQAVGSSTRADAQDHPVDTAIGYSSPTLDEADANSLRPLDWSDASDTVSTPPLPVLTSPNLAPESTANAGIEWALSSSPLTVSMVAAQTSTPDGEHQGGLDVSQILEGQVLEKKQSGGTGAETAEPGQAPNSERDQSSAYRAQLLPPPPVPIQVIPPPDAAAEANPAPESPVRRLPVEGISSQQNSSPSAPDEAVPDTVSASDIEYNLTQLPLMGVTPNHAAPMPPVQVQPTSVPQTQAQAIPPWSAGGASFPDIQGHWAQDFIEPLAQRNILRGFPDGTFRPDATLTRAQFAAMIRQAFEEPRIRETPNFLDVPNSYWAAQAINEAYEMHFFNGYPSQFFMPEQNISRADTLVALTDGLKLMATTTSPNDLDRLFQDADQIPDYAEEPVAEAVEHQFVVNFPDVTRLRPQQPSTRAEAAAAIYQALVEIGAVAPLRSPATRYIVGYVDPTPPPQSEAEQLQTLRQQYQIPAPPVVGRADSARTASLGVPAFTISSPTAFGADWRDIFFGAGFQERTRYSNRSDGAIGLGFGIGDARDAVGLEFVVSIVDLGGEGAFEDGGVSFKLHRQFGDNYNWAIAAGVENFATFGDTDGGSSGYGVVSRRFQFRDEDEPFSSLTASLGIGGGRFRAEDDLDEETIGVFGSVGLRLLRPLSLIADWTGQDLNLGLSIAPFRNFPLVITPGVADVTGNAGDGARFILGIGAGYSF